MLDFNLKYIRLYTDYTKWRYAYLGGRNFIDNYLEKYSTRESDDDFALRKAMTYCPAFAKTGINEIRNSIYDRMSYIVRESNCPSYNYAVANNVDHAGSSMNLFIGRDILTELLVMGRVAVCVDMPSFQELNHQTANDIHPYLYYYTAEQICDWKYDNFNRLSYLLLQKGDMTYITYQLLENKTVAVQTFDGRDTQNPTTTTILNIPRIPVHICELSASLMEDVADYQVALLNICSSDITFVWKANYPLFVEQWDMAGGKPPEEIKTGTLKGRRYPKGVEMPQYVAPPSDCLKASIEKQEQLKQEIRSLLNLSLANLTTARRSAESQQEQNSKEETGLSYIGLALQSLEKEICETWCAYENIKPIIHIKYPEKYSLKDRETVIKEAKELLDSTKDINSPTFRKEMTKKVVKALFEGTVSPELLTTIGNEIDNNNVVNTDPEVIHRDVELGLVTTEYASKLRGYPDGEAEDAREDNIEKLKQIALAQSIGQNKAILSDNPKDPTGKAGDNKPNEENPNRKLRGKAK